MKVNRDYINKLIQSIEEGDATLGQLQRAIHDEFDKLESYENEIRKEFQAERDLNNYKLKSIQEKLIDVYQYCGKAVK